MEQIEIKSERLAALYLYEIRTAINHFKNGHVNQTALIGRLNRIQDDCYSQTGGDIHIQYLGDTEELNLSGVINSYIDTPIKQDSKILRYPVLKIILLKWSQ